MSANSSFTGNTNNFLPQNYIIPEEQSEKDYKLREYLNNIATAVNTKDSGIYDAVETITGQLFLPVFSSNTGANANYRSVFRKVVNFGSLPNTATKSVAHGITFSNDFSVTKLYAAATNPGTSWIPIPYASPTLANNIELNCDSNNVNIITGSNRTAFTRCFVVIEFIKTT
jgi:hypothetical protein